MDTSHLLCGLQEDEPQTASLMSFVWASLTTDSMLTIQSVHQFGPMNDFCVT